MAAKPAPKKKATPGGVAGKPERVKTVEIAEIGSRLDSSRWPLNWSARIESGAKAYLHIDPNRPGAKNLRKALECVALMRKCIEAKDSSGAAWMASAAVQAIWQAEVADARAMIDLGARAVRGRERANVKKSRDAAPTHDQWQRQANAYWEKRPNLTVRAVARLIDAARFETIRRVIKKSG